MFCRFCGASLNGPFCAQCGKKDDTASPTENQGVFFAPKEASREQGQRSPFYFPVKTGADQAEVRGSAQKQTQEAAVYQTQDRTPPAVTPTKPSTAYSPFALAENPAQYAQAPVEFGKDYKPQQTPPPTQPSWQQAWQQPRQAVQQPQQAPPQQPQQAPQVQQAWQPPQQPQQPPQVQPAWQPPQQAPQPAAVPTEGEDFVGSFDEEEQMTDTVLSAQDQADREKDREKKKKRREKREKAVNKPLKTDKKLFPAVLAFFMPLVYLVLDLFVVYPASMLQMVTDDVSALGQLVDWMTSPAYDIHSTRELFSQALGEGSSITYLSLRGLFSGTADLLPVLVVLLTVVLSVICGVLLILTRGSILKKRIISDLMVTVGLAAAFSPMLAYAVKTVALFFASGDLVKTEAGIALFGVGVEALLAMLLCALFLLPAVRTLSVYGANQRGERIPIGTISNFLGRKFLLAKIFAAVVLIGGIAIGAGVTIGIVLTVGKESSFVDLMNAFGESLRLLFSKESSVNLWIRFFVLFEQLLRFLLIVMMCLVILVPIARTLRILFLKHTSKKPISRQERSGEVGSATGHSLRNLLILPFATYVAFYVITSFLLLLASRIALRIDFSDTALTMDIVYYVIAYVRTLGGMGVGYLLTLTASFPLWHLAQGLSNAMARERVACQKDVEEDEE